MSFSFRQITKEEIEAMTLDEAHCLEYVANEKWRDGFHCRHCGNTNYCSGKKPFSRRCTRCKREESATAHTVFHGCRLPLTQAFTLAYQVCHDPSVSTYELSRRLSTRQMTCWKLKKKILECIQNSDSTMQIPDFREVFNR